MNNNDKIVKSVGGVFGRRRGRDDRGLDGREAKPNRSATLNA